MKTSTHPAVAALSAPELLRDGYVNEREAMAFAKKSRAEIQELMRSGALPWTRGANRERAIPKRALAAILAHEWETTGEPELLPVPAPVSYR